MIKSGHFKQIQSTGRSCSSLSSNIWVPGAGVFNYCHRESAWGSPLGPFVLWTMNLIWWTVFSHPIPWPPSFSAQGFLGLPLSHLWTPTSLSPISSTVWNSLPAPWGLLHQKSCIRAAGSVWGWPRWVDPQVGRPSPHPVLPQHPAMTQLPPPPWASGAADLRTPGSLPKSRVDSDLEGVGEGGQVRVPESGPTSGQRSREARRTYANGNQGCVRVWDRGRGRRAESEVPRPGLGGGALDQALSLPPPTQAWPHHERGSPGPAVGPGVRR